MTGRTLMPLLAGERQAGPGQGVRRAGAACQVAPGRPELSDACGAGPSDFSTSGISARTAGRPATRRMEVAVGPFGDIDGGPSKDFLLARRNDPAIAGAFDWPPPSVPPRSCTTCGEDPDQAGQRGRPTRVPVRAGAPEGGAREMDARDPRPAGGSGRRPLGQVSVLWESRKVAAYNSRQAIARLSSWIVAQG